MTSPTNTAGMEVVAWRFKLAMYYPWDVCLTDPRCDTSDFDAVEPLVTAASAQAIIDRLKLAICGGEDVPGSIALVTVGDCERFCREAQAQHGDLIDRAQAAEARVAELEAAKWETKHADTMNDLVAMGLARDAAEARADRLADGITAAMLILTPEPGDKSLTEREKTARQLLAALQDQPK